jgi:hypothetical protein
VSMGSLGTRRRANSPLSGGWVKELRVVKFLEEFQTEHHNSTGAAAPGANAKGSLRGKEIPQ